MHMRVRNTHNMQCKYPPPFLNIPFGYCIHDVLWAKNCNRLCVGVQRDSSQVQGKYATTTTEEADSCKRSQFSFEPIFKHRKNTVAF